MIHISKMRILEFVPGALLLLVIVGTKLFTDQNKWFWSHPLFVSISVLLALFAFLVSAVGLMEEKSEWPVFYQITYISVHLVSIFAGVTVLVRAVVLPLIPQAGEFFR